MKLITKKSLLRIGILLILIILILYYVSKMPGRSYQGKFDKISSEEEVIAQSLRKDIAELSSGLEERNRNNQKYLIKKIAYIEKRFAEIGYTTKKQEFEVYEEKFYNIETELPGADKKQEIIVIGAHYDTAYGTPGANDNSSGVASLLAIAKSLAGKKTGRTIRFVAFTNEEPPYFYTSNMGSYVYAKRCKERKENIVAMLSLETLGYYTDEENSQKFPGKIFSLIYPSKGNFISFVGNISSGKLVRKAIGLFRKHGKFPSEGISVPGWITGINWSDHWSFWEHGYPAIMVTDTAPFRYPYYHHIRDTADKISYPQLTKVVKILSSVVEDMGNE